MKAKALAYHAGGPGGRPGKLSVTPTKPCINQDDLSLAYTPGVAEVCLAIEADENASFAYTSRANLVAVVTNGTAVLGLGNLGPSAAKPVMEGKAVLFKRFADVDVFDLELTELDPDKFVETVQRLEPTFGGINLEDIKAPECFEIEKKLSALLDIPVFHDDQHGTAIITAAGLINALDLQQKAIEDVVIVVSGAGAAAIACCDLFLELGAQRHNILLVDSRGVVSINRSDLNEQKRLYAADTTKKTLADALEGADVFLGVSVGGLVSGEMILGMNERPIIFALSNPDPEIPYDEAREARPDAIVATGRSDYPNQVNNVLGFPFIFRGALDVRARSINVDMRLAAAKALASIARLDVPQSVRDAYSNVELSYGPDYIIPKPFDQRVMVEVSSAVARAAIESGVARGTIEDWDAYRAQLLQRVQF